MTHTPPHIAQPSTGLTEEEIAFLLPLCFRNASLPNLSSSPSAIFARLTLGLCYEYFDDACTRTFLLYRVPPEVWKPLALEYYVKQLKERGWTVASANSTGNPNLNITLPEMKEQSFESTIALLRENVCPSVVPLCAGDGLIIAAAIFVRGVPGLPEERLLITDGSAIARENCPSLSILWGGELLRVEPQGSKNGLAL